jgi:hypothetical protein
VEQSCRREISKQEMMMLEVLLVRQRRHVVTQVVSQKPTSRIGVKTNGPMQYKKDHAGSHTRVANENIGYPGRTPASKQVYIFFI